MPHKFWSVRPRTNDDNEHNIFLPETSGEYHITKPGDLMVAGGGPAGNEHDHTIIGGNYGAPNPAFPTHYHWFIRKPDQTIEQITIGAANHNHTSALDAVGRVLPKFYLLLVTCDDAAYDTFIADGWIEFAERPYDPDTGTFGPLDQTEWGAAARTKAENLVLNNLGLALPDIISNDKEFLIWLLDVGAYRYEDEAKHE